MVIDRKENVNQERKWEVVIRKRGKMEEGNGVVVKDIKRERNKEL